jgi:hypothetical protein
MSTTSTIPTVKARIVTVLTTALATAGTSGGQVPVTYAWPGPSTEPECVFLGPHPETADIRLDASHQVPTIKAGRKQRQEDYPVRVTVWEFRPDLSPSDADDAEARAFLLAGAIEDALANDPTLGLAQGVVQHITVGDISSTLFPFQKGWACELAIDVQVKARLT